MKASDLLEEAIATLKASSAIDHWQKDREEIEAEELLLWALSGDEFEPDEEIGPIEAKRFRGYVSRRALGEPTQLIKGFADFRGIEISVSPGVFVPRDSSEFLAEQAIKRLARRDRHRRRVRRRRAGHDAPSA